MKLATYKDGSRDGQLVVVSRDLSTAHYATGIAGKMQQLLDDWNFIAPQLEDLYQTLNQGKARHAFAFEPRQCMAPLPRAYQWLDGSAYANHIHLISRGRGAEAPTVRTGTIAVRGADEYAYVVRDVRRIVVIGGSLVAFLLGVAVALTLWFNAQRTDRYGEDLYMNHLFLPALRLAPPVGIVLD